MEKWGCILDLEMCQRANDLPLGWINIQLLAVLTPRRGLVYRKPQHSGMIYKGTVGLKLRRRYAFVLFKFEMAKDDTPLTC